MPLRPVLGSVDSVVTKGTCAFVTKVPSRPLVSRRRSSTRTLTASLTVFREAPNFLCSSTSVGSWLSRGSSPDSICRRSSSAISWYLGCCWATMLLLPSLYSPYMKGWDEWYGQPIKSLVPTVGKNLPLCLFHARTCMVQP